MSIIKGCLSKKGVKMNLKYFDNFNWENLEFAYGSAKNAPKSLRILAKSTDEDEIEEAIYGFLHSEACHQYTTYSGTPAVVNCMLYILENRVFEEEHLLGIISFIQACTTYSACSDMDLQKEILKGKELYDKLYDKHFTNQYKQEIKNRLEKLLKFVEK